jgi:hypothetical protein
MKPEAEPMRRYLFLGVVVAALALLQTAPADPAPQSESPPKTTEDWKEDPVCRMVFFAVLEGLYTDGVSTEAVDRVVGRKKGGPPDVKQTFVIQCPLCHPVYEAFCLYQQRPAFQDGKRDTLGKGLDPRLEEGLRSEGILARQRALEVVVRDWVGRRLAQMRLTDEEKRDWVSKLEERSNQGRKLLRELRGTDPVYRLWPGYGKCAACEGTTSACRILKAAEKK